MVRTSSLRTITILRETLESLERRPSYDPNAPVFIHLKCRILYWITELYLIAVQTSSERSIPPRVTPSDSTKEVLFMDSSQKMEFVRKRNNDQTIHSHCSQCFATVADAMSPADVFAAEEEHKCDPRLMEMVEKYRILNHLDSAA